MRGLVIFGALALSLGGCLQQTSERSAPVAHCEASASAALEGVDGVTVEAASMGPDCAGAVATIVVRDANGVLWAQAYAAAQVMTLASAGDTGAMHEALADWLDSSNRAMATSAALPDWPQGADTPVSGEFPFYVVESLSRADYLALRERNVPVYCYVQGMESQNCLAIENGVATEIGVQTFPG